MLPFDTIKARKSIIIHKLDDGTPIISARDIMYRIGVNFVNLMSFIDRAIYRGVVDKKHFIETQYTHSPVRHDLSGKSYRCYGLTYEAMTYLSQNFPSFSMKPNRAAIAAAVAALKPADAAREERQSAALVVPVAQKPQSDDPFPGIFQSRIGGAIVEAIDARELHHKLGVRRDFTHWIRDRIDTINLVQGQAFEESQDFVLAKNGENKIGHRPASVFTLTLDAAKHIAMSERNEIGYRIRDYFIRAEKELRGQSGHRMLVDFNDPYSLRNALLEQNQRFIEERQKVIALSAEVTQREGVISELEPKALALDNIAAEDGHVMWKRMVDNITPLGGNDRLLSDFVKAKKWMYRSGGSKDIWVCHRDMIRAGYVAEKKSTYDHPKRIGMRVESTTAMFTLKGMTVINQHFAELHRQKQASKLQQALDL